MYSLIHSDDSTGLEFATEHDGMPVALNLEITVTEAMTIAAIPTYNEALLLYQKRLYGHAIDKLEVLFRALEPLDEMVAVNTCLLLLECYLFACDPQK